MIDRRVRERAFLGFAPSPESTVKPSPLPATTGWKPPVGPGSAVSSRVVLPAGCPKDVAAATSIAITAHSAIGERRRVKFFLLVSAGPALEPTITPIGAAPATVGTWPAFSLSSYFC